MNDQGETPRNKPSSEKKSNTEILTHITPALTAALDEFEKVDSFQNTEFEGAGNLNEMDEFNTITSLGLTADKLKHHTGVWEQKVENKKKEVKELIKRSGDILSAIEIDEAYVMYLLAIGKLDQAITLAQHITDEYSVTNRSDIFDRKKLELLAKTAAELIKLGKLYEAEEVIADLDLTEFGNAYFYTLAVHYKEEKNIPALQALINDLENRIEAAEEDLRDSRVPDLQYLADQARMMVTELEGEPLDAEASIEDSFEATTEIESLVLRINERTRLIGEFVKKGQVEIAREKTLLLIKELNTHTTREKDPQILIPSSFLSNAYRAGTLINLAKIWAIHPDYQTVFTICLYGEEEEENKGSVAYSIGRASEKNQASLWTQLMEIYAIRADQSQVDDLYESGLEQFEESPTSQDDIMKKYAEIVVHFDLKKAVKTALEMFDLPKKADTLVNVLSTYFHEKGLKDWESIVTPLAKTDNEIDSAQSSSDVDKEYRRLPGILQELAKLAIQQGEWQEFQKIFNHQGWTDSLKIHFMKELTAELTDQGRVN